MPLLAQRPATEARTLPRVHFVATGGTISNKEGGRLTAAELAKSMPGVERFADLSHEQFTNVASSELSLKDWLNLSRRVNEVFAADKDLAAPEVAAGLEESFAGGVHQWSAAEAAESKASATRKTAAKKATAKKA